MREHPIPAPGCLLFAEEARLQIPQVPFRSQEAIGEARGWVLT